MGPCVNQGQLETVERYVEDRQGRRGEARGGRQPALGRRPREGLLPRADDLRRLLAEDARRPRGDLRAGRLGHPGEVPRRGDRGRQRRRVRPVRVDLHPGRQQGVHGDARDVHRASSTSTPPRSAPRPTCPSAARRAPGTATARPACRRSRSSPSGSPSTSTSAGSSSAPRSTDPRIIARLEHGRFGTGRAQARGPARSHSAAHRDRRAGGLREPVPRARGALYLRPPCAT